MHYVIPICRVQSTVFYILLGSDPANACVPTFFLKKRRAPLLFLQIKEVLSIRTIKRSAYERYRFDEILRRGQQLQDRALLDMVDINWYVETGPCADGKCQGGNVIQVVRDKYGLPVGLKVADSPTTYDWVSPERVVFFEPDIDTGGYEDYMSYEELAEEMRAWGYQLRDDGMWYNPDTDEVVGY